MTRPLNPQNSIHNVTVQKLAPTSQDPKRKLTHTSKYRSPSFHGKTRRFLRGKR